MDYEKALIEFLSHKDNLPFVLEIGEKVEQIKEKLHIKFWRIVENNIQEQLVKSPHYQKWRVRVDDNLFSSWSGLTITPVSDLSLHIRPRLEQWSGDLNIFYGIHWSQENRKPITINELSEFLTQLKNDGLASSSAYWLAYKRTDIRPRSKDFLMKVSSNAESFATDISNLLWLLFSINAEEIEKINELIEKNGGNA